MGIAGFTPRPARTDGSESPRQAVCRKLPCLPPPRRLVSGPGTSLTLTGRSAPWVCTPESDVATSGLKVILYC